jgi:hypothetical protein
MGQHHDEGMEGLRPPPEVDAADLAPVDLGLGARRGLDAAERPQLGCGIAGPYEPQDRAVGAPVLVLTDEVVVQGPDLIAGSGASSPSGGQPSRMK